MQPPDMQCILQEFDSPAEAELAHGVRLVNFDCLVAQVQIRGDLFVAVTLRDETEHFGLAITKGGHASTRARSFLRGKRRGEMMGQGGIDVLLAGGGGPNRSKQLRVWTLFQDVRRRPGTEKLLEKRLVGVAGQTDHREVRPKLLQFPCCDHPADAGH